MLGAVVERVAGIGYGAFLREKVLEVVTPDTPALMLHRQVDVDSATGYCFGILVRTSTGEPVYFHDGDTTGFLSRSEIHPRQQVSIVVLTNLHTFHPEKTVAQLAEIASAG